jgi:hypothetical protein
MSGAPAKTAVAPPTTTSATGKMKPAAYSPAEAQSRRAIPQGAWASRPPSTQGRDGSPQPSEDSNPSVFSVSFDSLAPARLALRANLRLLHLAFPKRSIVVNSFRHPPSALRSPDSDFSPLPIRVHPSPFAGQRFPLRELVSFEHALDHRMAKKTPANHANPHE